MIERSCDAVMDLDTVFAIVNSADEPVCFKADGKNEMIVMSREVYEDLGYVFYVRSKLEEAERQEREGAASYTLEESKKMIYDKYFDGQI